MRRFLLPFAILLLSRACTVPAAEDTTAAPEAAPAAPEAAPAAGTPRPGSRFTIAVIPDTQYLFDQDRGNADVLAASLTWIVEHAAERNIVFVAHLGDIVENAAPGELADAGRVFGILDDHGMPYSVPAGNHDLRDQRTDDGRGHEPYLDIFPPQRFARDPTFGGASPSGFNKYHVFTGAGRRWLLLSLDWRPSDASLAWAQGVIKRHPDLPVILTTHDLAYDGGDPSALGGGAVLSDHGQRLWDQLIRRNDQVFLTINGHFWPPARTVLRNDSGHDVHVHLANYQDRYYGGSGMIRLYEIDVAARTIDVTTFSPWVLRQPPAERNPLAQLEAELVDARNRFLVPIDFAERFRGFSEPPPPPLDPVPADRMLVPGTVAYWRFDDGRAGEPVAGVVRDRSGHGNDLRRVDLPNGAAGDLVWTREHHPRQPGHGSLFVRGSKHDPAFGGAYLQTVDAALLNALTFERGYTIEAFVKLPADCCGSRHEWMGVLSRQGNGRDAGRTGDDPEEPVTTLTIPPGAGFQWAVYPAHGNNIKTNWSHQAPTETWLHVAVINDGRHSVMYLDGAKLLRNPRSDSVGLATLGLPWMVGATHYGNVVEQSFYGWLGDVRIVDRPLALDELMIARR